MSQSVYQVGVTLLVTDWKTVSIHKYKIVPVEELSFAHVTTKTIAYSGVFDFFRQKLGQKSPTPHQNHFFKYDEKSIFDFF